MSEPTERQIDAAMATLDARGLGGRNGMRAALKAAFEAADAPAADVREALAECVHAGLRRDDWGAANEDEREEPLAVSDAILDLFEVRPRGTVTDAEVRFVGHFIRQAGYVVPIHVVRSALEECRKVESGG